MQCLHFEYDMEIGYSVPVSRCYFTIKCIPRDNMRQRLVGMELTLWPEAGYSTGEDSFGNKKIYGCIQETHERFLFHISGTVETGLADYEEDAVPERAGIYRCPYGKCRPGPGLIRYCEVLGLSDNRDHFLVCTQLMRRLHEDFQYAQNVTGTDTTAEEAWNLRKGVCQDYAHIYITLLRVMGIPARYVCGLMIGEGASHAWTEALCDGKWIGFDPTNNCVVGENYIKLGDGRDASDCAINRGVMWGGGAQSQKISVTVKAEDQKI